MRLLKTLMAVSVAAPMAIAASQGASAAEVLRIASWIPPHAMNKVVLPKWIAAIEKATEGRVTGKIEFGLAPPPGMIDLVEDGSADVAWIFHGYSGGRFVTTKLIELPGYTGDAEAASVAHWRAHEKYLKKADEHSGVRVVALFTHGPGQMHMREPISGLGGLKGKKIRIGGGVSGDVAKALGVVGVQVPAPKVYETLSGGVADGVWMPMETNKSLRLYEVAPNTTMVPGGLYRGSFGMVMSDAALARLSEKDRKAVLSTTGEVLSAMIGRAWAEADEAGMANAKKVGVKFTEASAEDMAMLGKIAADVRAKVIAEVKAKGIDADAAIADIEATFKSYGK